MHRLSAAVAAIGSLAAVAPAATFTATNILLHERDYVGLQREFRIETIPSVPEPASFVLAAAGLIGLVGWRRRKR
ncbi:MAG: PEP-CTERM sorting domain-containing protein [Chloroflexota bacterium]